MREGCGDLVWSAGLAGARGIDIWRPLLASRSGWTSEREGKKTSSGGRVSWLQQASLSTLHSLRGVQLDVGGPARQRESGVSTASGGGLRIFKINNQLSSRSREIDRSISGATTSCVFFSLSTTMGAIATSSRAAS